MCETVLGSKNTGVLLTLVDCRKRRINTAKPIPSSQKCIERKFGTNAAELRLSLGKMGVSCFSKDLAVLL